MNKPLDESKLFVHYNGLYFTLDGQSFISKMPSARDTAPPHDANLLLSRNVLSTSQLKALAPDNIISTLSNPAFANITFQEDAMSYMDDLLSTADANQKRAEIYQAFERQIRETANGLNVNIPASWSLSRSNAIPSLGHLPMHEIVKESAEQLKQIAPDILAQHPTKNYWHRYDDGLEYIDRSMDAKRWLNAYLGRETSILILDIFEPTYHLGLEHTAAYDVTQHQSYANYLQLVIDNGLSHAAQLLDTAIADTVKIDDPAELQSALQSARDIYARELNNQEAKFLIENGEVYAIDVTDARLSATHRAFIMPGDANYNNARTLGYANAYNKLVVVESSDLDDTRDTFREEHFHRVDAYAREMMGIESDRHISHEILFDEVRNKALNQQNAHDLPYYSTSTPSGNRARSKTFADETIRTGRTDDPYVKAIAHEQGIRIEDLNRAELEWAYNQAAYLNTKLESAIELPAYSDRTRNATDDEHGNGSQDTETMVKFHVLRMELEDRFAAYDATYEADYVNPDTRATRVLASITPEFNKVYTEQWLPMTTITTHVNDPELRTMLLRAHASLRDHQDIADGVTSAISETEVTAINARIAEVEDTLEYPVRFMNRTGADNDFLAIGDNVRIPVQIASTRGEMVAPPVVMFDPPAMPAAPVPIPAPTTPIAHTPPIILQPPAPPVIGMPDEPPIIVQPPKPEPPIIVKPPKPEPPIIVKPPKPETLATITMSELRDGNGAIDQTRTNGSLAKGEGTETARFDASKINVDDVSQITDITVLHQLVEAHKQYNNGIIVNADILNIADTLSQINGQEDHHFITEHASSVLQKGYFKQLNNFQSASSDGGDIITRAEHDKMIRDAANAATSLGDALVTVDRHQKTDDISSALPNAASLKQQAINNEAQI